MKKFAILALMVSVVVGGAFATDYGTGNVVLTGRVTKTASVSITGVAGVYNLLNLSSSSYSSTKLKVADAAVTTNMKAWTITATSANTWKFKNSASEAVDYVLYVSDDAGSTYAITTPTTTSITYTNNKGSNLPFGMYITYSAGGSTLTSDDAYTDTITLTVSAS